MSKPPRVAAALVIFNGFGLAPVVQPLPHGSMLPCSRVVPIFLQLAKWLTTFAELDDTENGWAPFETFRDAHGVTGIALAPWLRGGAAWLQTILRRHDIELPHAVMVPIERWYQMTSTAVAYLDLDVSSELAEHVYALLDRYDTTNNVSTDNRKLIRANYYQSAHVAMDLFGLETDSQRIIHLRRKTLANT
jgi:hypothetical protein